MSPICNVCHVCNQYVVYPVTLLIQFTSHWFLQILLNLAKISSFQYLCYWSEDYHCIFNTFHRNYTHKTTIEINFKPVWDIRVSKLQQELLTTFSWNAFSSKRSFSIFFLMYSAANTIPWRETSKSRQYTRVALFVWHRLTGVGHWPCVRASSHWEAQLATLQLLPSGQSIYPTTIRATSRAAPTFI